MLGVDSKGIDVDRSLALSTLIALVLAASASSATPTTYRLDVEITRDSWQPANVGTIVPLFMTFDSATPDENPLADEFSATDTGSLEFTYAGEFQSTFSTVDASVGAGAWSATSTASDPVAGDVDLIIDIIGLGLTGDQILPDFTLVSGGLFLADHFLVQLEGDIIGLSQIPEPGSALLVATGLGALGLRRRHTA